MQATKRVSEASLIQELMDEPQRFQFMQAVRILLQWMRHNGVAYDQAFAEVLRFQNSLSLKFPAGEVEAILPEKGRSQISLTPTFIGLLGMNGTLPFHKTERIAAAQAWDGDISAKAFVDLFSHRMVAMFFQAWGKYRLEHRFDTQGKDGQLPLLMALAGIDPAAFTSGGKPGDFSEVAGYYSTLLRTRPVAASSVSSVLSHHFGVPIELESFVESWDLIPESMRSKVGGKVAKLGFGATLGGRLRRRDLRIRLNIGPLQKNDVDRFLPRRSASMALAKIVPLFGLPNLEFEVRLILSPSCIGGLVLSTKPCVARRLGWDAFLPSGDGWVSRNTIAYLLRQSITNDC